MAGKGSISGIRWLMKVATGSQEARIARAGECLKRVRFGPIFIPSSVKRGQFQELAKPEIDKP